MRLRLSVVSLAACALLPLSACGSSSSSGSAWSGTSVPAATGGTPSNAASGPPGCPPAAGTATRTTTFAAPPPMCLDTARAYTADVTTDVGVFRITLDAEKAPNTVNNFVFLARNKYYDGTVFHRVIKGFMNQGGDPLGNGQGGPGYQFADELPQAGQYSIGSVAMANAGPNTNGSQFFIVTGTAGTQLPPNYGLFGKVTSGMATLKKIEADGSAVGPQPPAKVHTITKVTITEK